MNDPNLIDRAKFAWQIFRHDYKKFLPYFQKEAPGGYSVTVPTWPMEGKAAPFMWPSWRLGQPQWQIINYQAYAQEGYNENAVVFSAIMYKVRAITSAPLRAYGGTMDEPELLDADHPLQKLVQRPNPYMSWSEFQGSAEVYFNLAGNCYVYVAKDDRQQAVPTDMWLLRPDRVYIVPHPDYRSKEVALACHPAREQKKEEINLNAARKAMKAKDDTKIVGYWYVPEGRNFKDGIPYLPQDIIHIKLPNPLDPLDGLGYGIAPLSPGARSGDVDNSVTKYLKNFFDRGAMPPGLLRYKVPLTDAQAARARERFMEIYGSSEEWFKVAVLDLEGEYQRLALTFQEMGFENIDGRNESRIVAPFGVPLTLIESRPTLVQSTYSNKETDRKMFWEDTMIPELRWFQVEYQYYLQGERGEFVQFDLSKVPALMPSANELRERAAEAFKAGGITRDEYRAAIGFDPAPGDRGNVYLYPLTLQEVPAEVMELSEPVAPPEPEGDTQEGMPEAGEDLEGEKALPVPKGLTAEQKAAFWKQTDAQARSWEKHFGWAAVEAFRHDLREILAIVGEGKAKALEDKATVAWGMVLLGVTDYLAMAGADNWRTTFIPVLRGLVMDRGQQLNTEFGMEFDIENLLAQEWFEEYTLTFAQPILATTEKELSAMFMQAQSEGWSVPTMQKRLEQIFQQWMDGDLSAEDFAWFEQRMPAYRREMIARTETIRSSNAGSEALYRNWGVQSKEWYSTPDSRTRDAHRIGAAWGEAPLVVPINASFDVGGESLRYPGDPQGSPENTVQCR